MHPVLDNDWVDRKYIKNNKTNFGQFIRHFDSVVHLNRKLKNTIKTYENIYALNNVWLETKVSYQRVSSTDDVYI